MATNTSWIDFTSFLDAKLRNCFPTLRGFLYLLKEPKHLNLSMRMRIAEQKKISWWSVIMITFALQFSFLILRLLIKDVKEGYCAEYYTHLLSYIFYKYSNQNAAAKLSQNWCHYHFCSSLIMACLVAWMFPLFCRLLNQSS